MSKVDDKHASSDEKLDVIEHVSRPSSSCDDIEASSQSEADEKFTRATNRKIDIRLLFILGSLYAAAYIDRINVSIARVAGMGTDLQLQVGERYSIITLIFFVGYIVFEYPSILIMQKVGCKLWLPTICLAFGAITVGMAFATSWESLVVCRALLGIAEAGFFPGCSFLISTWYTRYETQKRLAVFYLTSKVIGAFANIIGFAITKMDGIGGLEAWRWVFLVFGLATCALALASFFLVLDFPTRQTYLTPAETKWVVDRINKERGDAAGDEQSTRTKLGYLLEWRLIVYGVLFGAATFPSYAFAYFLPVILSGGGYSTELALILSMPPNLCASIWIFVSAWASDKYKARSIIIVMNAILCIVGLLILGFAPSIGARYVGSFLGIAGCQANLPGVLALQANNILGHSKRAVGSAMIVGFGGVGGILASVSFAQRDFPRYLPGLYTTIGAQAITIILLGVFAYASHKENKKVDAGTLVIEGHPGFKYTI